MSDVIQPSLDGELEGPRYLKPDVGERLTMVIGEPGFPGFYIGATIAETDGMALTVRTTSGVSTTATAEGAEIRLTCFSKGAAFRASAQVEHFDSDDKAALLRLRVPAEGFKNVNLRRHVRVPTRAPLRYRPVSFPTGLEADPAVAQQMQAWHQGLARLAYDTEAIDISDGGICTYLVGDIPLLQQDQVYLQVGRPGRQAESAAKIVWIALGLDPRGARIGLEFVGLSNQNATIIRQLMTDV